MMFLIFLPFLRHNHKISTNKNKLAPMNFSHFGLVRIEIWFSYLICWPVAVLRPMVYPLNFPVGKTNKHYFWDGYYMCFDISFCINIFVFVF